MLQKLTICVVIDMQTWNYLHGNVGTILVCWGCSSQVHAVGNSLICSLSKIPSHRITTERECIFVVLYSCNLVFLIGEASLQVTDQLFIYYVLHGMARLSLTSSARVISMVARALIEFELCVRTEERPEDEPKGDCLIEGCTEFTNLFASDSYIEHRRLYGNTCALDVKFAVLINAVEARIDVEVPRLGAIASGINLKVYAKTSGFKEVIGLFEDAAPKPGAVMSFVVAVETHNYLDPYIEGSPRDNPVLGQKENQVLRSWWKCSFGSSYHCMDEEVAELGDFGELSVKINWKSYRKREF